MYEHLLRFVDRIDCIDREYINDNKTAPKHLLRGCFLCVEQVFTPPL